MVHQVEHDVVEQRGDEFVLLIGADAHAASLISEQRSVKEEELPDRSFVSAMDGGEQPRGRRITRGGDDFVVFTPRSVVAVVHRIPASSLVVASASLTDAHRVVTSRFGGSSCGASS